MGVRARQFRKHDGSCPTRPVRRPSADRGAFERGGDNATPCPRKPVRRGVDRRSPRRQARRRLRAGGRNRQAAAERRRDRARSSMQSLCGLWRRLQGPGASRGAGSPRRHWRPRGGSIRSPNDRQGNRPRPDARRSGERGVTARREISSPVRAAAAAAFGPRRTRARVRLRASGTRNRGGAGRFAGRS